MDAEAAVAWVDAIIPPQTGERLSDLQKVILVQVWLGRKYLDIAHSYGCTEGHAKDAGSQLWKLHSKVLREKITKSNCRATVERVLRKTTAISSLIDYSRSPHPTPKLEDTNFIGRTEAIAHLNTLVNQGSKVIVIQGERGLGKTTLAQQYLQTQGFDLVLERSPTVGETAPSLTSSSYIN